MFSKKEKKELQNLFRNILYRPNYKISDKERALLFNLMDDWEESDYGLYYSRVDSKAKKDLDKNRLSLNEVLEKSIYKEGALTDNLLIEGDNLYSLNILMKNYEGQIGVIYIDPPYNTKNDAFIYNDKFEHSEWLTFMKERLDIAHKLLADDGIIFISIDDNEQAYLKLLCDSIFGEKNFIVNGIRNVKKGGSNDTKGLVISYEYFLIYVKNRDKFVFNQNVLDIENDIKYKYVDEYVDRRGKYYLRDLQYKGGKPKVSDYPIKCPDGTLLYSDSNGKTNHEWRWSEERINWGIENGFIVFKKNKKDEWKVYIKQYQYVDNNDHLRVRTNPFSANVSFLNSDGSKEIKDILINSNFTYPKPKDFVKYLINLHTSKNIIVLDFFAGSGTTGHSVLELNKEDGGNRQFILCTNNENEICEKVTYERLKTVINGVRADGSKYDDEILANLTYYKVDLV